MTLLLLFIIYIAFIGLGIPDSLFGTAWPAISDEFSLPVSWANFVTLIISGGTIISSLLSARIINRFGTAAVTAVSTTMTAFALLGFSVSQNILYLCLCAIPLGLGAGAIDTALNNYVALHYKASHMNFLHCFYGIGVSLSPFIMSFALSKSSWQNGYFNVSLVQFGIALLTIISLPIWKKVRHSVTNSHSSPTRTLPLKTMLRNPKVMTACMVFLGSCGMEYTCGIWGSTYLVRGKGAAVDTAALMITFYYVGIAFGRFLSGILARKLTSNQLIRAGQITVLAALVLLILPLPYQVSAFSLFLIGMGNGTIYPNMLHLTPANFGEDVSQSVIGVQMAFSYVGILLAPAIFGLMAQYITISLFPYFILLCYVIMIVGTLKMNSIIKTGKDNFD